MSKKDKVWKRIMGLKKGDLVKVINEKCSCYGAVGKIVEIEETKEGKIYRIKVSPSTARLFYAYYYYQYEPLEENEEMLIWGGFKEEDLELIS